MTIIYFIIVNNMQEIQFTSPERMSKECSTGEGCLLFSAVFLSVCHLFLRTRLLVLNKENTAHAPRIVNEADVAYFL